MSAGWVRNYRVEPEQAIDLFERALRLSTYASELGYVLSGLGLALLEARAPAEALPHLVRAIGEMPNWTPGLQFRVVALQWLGREDEARQSGAKLMELVPRLRTRPEKWAMREGAFLEDFLAALRAAGVPG
jgi:tetratricopeptide (TPR) repeat protein